MLVSRGLVDCPNIYPSIPAANADRLVPQLLWAWRAAGSTVAAGVG